MECRFCLKKSPKNNIYELKFKILQIIEEMLKIDKEDEFPKLICNTCVAKVESIEKFLRQCEESDAYFRNNTSVSIKHEAEVFTSQWDDLIETNTDTAVQLAQVEILYTVCKEEAPIQTNTKGGSDLECSNSEDHVETNHNIQENNTSNESRSRKTKYSLRHLVETNHNIQENNTSNESRSRKTKYSCSHCPARYDSKHNYRSHIAIHNSRIQFVCHFCPIVFGSKKRCELHECKHHSNEYSNMNFKKGKRSKESGSVEKQITKQSHNGNVAEEGLDVSEDINIVDDVTEEMEGTESLVHTPDSSNKCAGDVNVTRNETNNKKANVIQSTKSYKGRNQEKRLFCRKCPAKYRNKDQFEAHIALHDSKNPIFTCQFCQTIHKTKNNCARHILKFHKDEALKMKLMKLERKRKKELEKMNFKSDSHLCSICGKCFPDNSCLKNHIATHSTEYIYECDICSRRCNSKQRIRTHMQSHSTATPYKCEHCPMMFKCINFRNRHTRRIHATNKQLFTCHICNKSVTTKTTLREHLRTHSGEKNFHCEKCSNSFRARALLSLHMARVHSDARPYACKYCSNSFKTRDYLRKHEMLHTGETPYKCPVCLRGYAQICNMKSHFKHNHRTLNFKEEMERYKMSQKQLPE